MSWFGNAIGLGTAPTTPTAAAAGDASESEFSKLIRDLAQDNIVKYGDEIRLFVRSNYLKKPKPAWLLATDPASGAESEQGWTPEELKGGFIGVYTKPDGTLRVMVPPLGNQAQGSFVESHFRIEPAQEGLKENSVGRNVSFGDKVVLIDGDGLVWNNKTGGLFGDGYLMPKQRATSGEAFVSFAKNGKNSFDPVQYGELGVYIDVVDSHRYRAGFNHRLTNFKGNFSNTAGGYVSSDGSGDALMFVIERYKGKIRNRQAGAAFTATATAAVAAGGEEELATLLPPPAPATAKLSSVSIVTHGVRDVQQFQPQFARPVYLYNLQPDSQVEVKLDNNMTVVIDGEEILRTNRHVQDEVLEAVWEVSAGASPQQEQKLASRWVQFGTSLVKLLVVYLVVVFALLFGVVMGMEDHHCSSRNLKRVSLTSITLCWLLGFTTPLRILPPAKSNNGMGSSSNNSRPIVLTIRDLQPVRKPVPATPAPATAPMLATSFATASSASAKLLRANSAGYASTMLVEASQDRWAELDETGMPVHYGFVRFLNGEKGNKESAIKRWEITGEWRRQFGVDLMLQRSHRQFFLIKKHYPTFLYGRAKDGNPIYIEQVGKINTKKIREAGGKLKDMMYHYVYTSEFMWNVLEPAEYGSSLTIMDVAGIGFFDFAGENLEFIKKATAVVQEHYPERGFMIFVINAPKWFTGVWAVVSSWVNPVTLKKIRICGTQYQDELFKFVDRSSLPICYGGTNPTPLENSEEERLFRNVAARALITHNDLAIGPDGNVIPLDQIKQMIDESVDHLAYKSQMKKVSSLDGSLLCDENGRPLERY